MKLVTWNIQWGRGADGVVDLSRMVREARAFCDFDVLCLQEVAANFGTLPGSAGEDQPALLADLLPGYSLHFGAATDVPDDSGGRRRFGNLIASRLPVGQVFRHALPWPADPASPSTARVAVEAVISAPCGPLRVLTTHLEYYSARVRMAQAEALLALHGEACAQARAPRPDEGDAGPFAAWPRPVSAVLCGDFNCRPDSPELARLTTPDTPPDAPALRDAWTLARTDSHPPTFRIQSDKEAPYCCDYLLVSEDLAPRVRRVAVEAQTRASDHQPLLIELGD